MDADVEAIKHAKEADDEKADELKNKVEEEIEDEENYAKENGNVGEPIIDEPDDDEEGHHNNVQHHQEVVEGEEESDEVTEVVNNEDNGKSSSSPTPIILPDDVKDVEFKVPHLPSTKPPHDPITTTSEDGDDAIATSETATSDATKDSEENGSST